MKFWTLTVLASVFVSTACFTAEAQAGGYAPPGSYQQLCTGISFNSGTQVLSASCASEKSQQGPGKFACATSLKVSACQPGADIESIQCLLQCQAQVGTWGQGGAVPKGSYQQSCIGWLVSNGVLSAQCWNFSQGKINWDGANNNNTTNASLNLSQCGMNGDIENIRGQLLCTQAATPVPGTCKPGFVWRQAIPSDHVCVTSATRQQTANDNAAAYTRTNMQSPAPPGQGHLCLQGFVWRQAVPNDDVCVLPYVRTQAAADNAAAPSRTY